MNPRGSFVISQFTNPSGEIVFQTLGLARLHAHPEELPHPCRGQRQVYDIGDLHSKAGIRLAIIRLTDEQLHEAEGAFQRLAARLHPLSFRADFTRTK